MKTNITISYGASAIMDLIDAEVSRHAGFLRFEDGSSAYDQVVIHTNDKPTITGYIADSFNAIVSRFDGECKHTQSGSTHTLGFYLPDFDNDLFSSATEEIRRYIVLSSTARWLMRRSFSEYANMVAVDSDSALNRAVSILRTRSFPLD